MQYLICICTLLFRHFVLKWLTTFVSFSCCRVSSNLVVLFSQHCTVPPRVLKRAALHARHNEHTPGGACLAPPSATQTRLCPHTRSRGERSRLACIASQLASGKASIHEYMASKSELVRQATKLAAMARLHSISERTGARRAITGHGAQLAQVVTNTGLKECSHPESSQREFKRPKAAHSKGLHGGPRPEHKLGLFSLLRPARQGRVGSLPQVSCTALSFLPVEQWSVPSSERGAADFACECIPSSERGAAGFSCEYIPSSERGSAGFSSPCD